MKKNSPLPYPARRHSAALRAVLFSAVLLLPAVLSAGAGEKAPGTYLTVPVKHAGFSYRVPNPPGAVWSENIQGIFICARAPFGDQFYSTQTFLSGHMIPGPGTLYFFSCYEYPVYALAGDGLYGSPLEAFEDLPPEVRETMTREERARLFTDLKNSSRLAAGPSEVLASLRFRAERWLARPESMDIRKNCGDQYPYFFKDAAVTTTRAALPPAGPDELAVRFEFHIASEQLGRPLDLSENALYFVLGPRVVKIGATVFTPLGEEEIFTVLRQWRDWLIEANPDLR